MLQISKDLSIEELDDCEHCGGSGWVATDEFDPDSGQYMRGVGEQRCLCNQKEDEFNER